MNEPFVLFAAVILIGVETPEVFALWWSHLTEEIVVLALGALLEVYTTDLEPARRNGERSHAAIMMLNNKRRLFKPMRSKRRRPQELCTLINGVLVD